MVQCRNLDEALKWAAEIPSAGRGPVEVRPIVEFGES
ncbi:MAG: YciI family protein [Gemmatimonadota bacterium]